MSSSAPNSIDTTRWHRVLASREVPRGSVRRARLLGHDLAVFRGEDRVARVLDGHCPHLGAHLAIGGKVRGNALSCPFHGWSFDGEGKCVAIPSCTGIPSGASVRSWPVREVDGEVLVQIESPGPSEVPDLRLSTGARYPLPPYPSSWYGVARSADVKRAGPTSTVLCGEPLRVIRDDRGEAHAIRGASTELPIRERYGLIFAYHGPDRVSPPFEPPVLGALGSGDWLPGKPIGWPVRVHVQEIAENAVDMAHFPIIHGHMEIPALESFETEGARLSVRFRSPLAVFGRVVESTTSVTYHGLGTVISHVTTAPAEVLILVTYAPLDPERLEVRAVYFIRRSNRVKDWIAPLFLHRNVREELWRDVAIWENKVYRERPLLCGVDGPIPALRKWARQFYETGTSE